MLAALICYQVQANTPTRQPKTIEVSGYQLVQHALPNGAPDPSAPDNSYLLTTVKWTVVNDSDKSPADEYGARVLTSPKLVFPMVEWYTESGKPSKEMTPLFTLVSRPTIGPIFVKRRTGTITTSQQTQPIFKGSHAIFYTRTTTEEQIETHTLGKKRVTEISHREFTGTGIHLDKEGTIFDISAEPICIRNGKAEVRIEPAKYTY